MRPNMRKLGNTIFVTIKSYSHKYTIHAECFSFIFSVAHVTFLKVLGEENFNFNHERSFDSHFLSSSLCLSLCNTHAHTHTHKLNVNI